MRLAVITLFPEVFQAYMGVGIMRRAVERSLVDFEVLHLRDFTSDRHRTVDDYPYGGGPGMVMKPEPVHEAVKHAKKDGLPTLTILLSPQGRPFTQQMAKGLSEEKRRLLFICGRYEGIDERVIQSLVDEEISIGDYVLTGGELPALVIIDAVVRLLPGALGDEDSLREESFSWGILDYPHYTRPPEWNGMAVPEVLLSGNHRQIVQWRRKEALRRTLRKRPELLRLAGLTPEDHELIRKIKEEDYEPDK
ncbi:MAG: tRNA (guanosine(37)-N1)-methyltransferase TrmD [Nitrospiraceae bacterium]|nr:tRNA (guanosine(37)-N1)-methyltransferase TrmD [Nitrospiraceae bacterium]